jgi:hypothetical protein
MRLAAKRDSNEAEIVAALLDAGATVERLNDPALPDLLVGYKGLNWLLEVKTARGRLTKAQQAWWAKPWAGQRAIVRTPDEALETIGATSGH